MKTPGFDLPALQTLLTYQLKTTADHFKSNPHIRPYKVVERSFSYRQNYKNKSFATGLNWFCRQKELLWISCQKEVA